jgi:HK97 gp10 family phage protein
MKGLPAKLENAVKEGLILSGDLIAQRAAQKARVDTGRMKRNIQRGNPVKTPTGMAISVGGNVSYLPYHEFGTGDKAEDPSKSKNPTRPGIAAQPMLRPALRESKQDAIRLIAKRILSKLVRL